MWFDTNLEVGFEREALGAQRAEVALLFRRFVNQLHVSAQVRRLTEPHPAVAAGELLRPVNSQLQNENHM